MASIKSFPVLTRLFFLDADAEARLELTRDLNRPDDRLQNSLCGWPRWIGRDACAAPNYGFGFDLRTDSRHKQGVAT